MAIERLRSSLLSPEELTVVAGRLVHFVGQALEDDSAIGKLTQLISLDIENLERTMARQRRSAYTAQLAQLSRLRESAYIALRDFARGNSNRLSVEIAEAGNTIYQIFQRRGLTLYRLGYNRQSAELGLLLDDLSRSEAVTAIDTIGAQAWVDELREAHEAFEQTLGQKLEQESQDDYASLAKARAQLSGSLDALLRYLRALHRSSATAGTELEQETYETVAETVSAIVSGVMTIARARRTRASNTESDNVTDALATDAANTGSESSSGVNQLDQDRVPTVPAATTLSV